MQAIKKHHARNKLGEICESLNLANITRLMSNQPQVIIAETISPKPELHEIEVAQILSKHYKCVIEFLQPIRGYKRRTPDMAACIYK